MENNINEFVNASNKKEHGNNKIMIRYSDRIKGTIPIGISVVSYVRSCVEIAYLIRNSPYRDLILNHIGISSDSFCVDQKAFTNNFKIGYFEAFFGNGSSNPPKNEIDLLMPSKFKRISDEINRLNGVITDKQSYVSELQAVSEGQQLRIKEFVKKETEIMRLIEEFRKRDVLIDAFSFSKIIPIEFDNVKASAKRFKAAYNVLRKLFMSIIGNFRAKNTAKKPMALPFDEYMQMKPSESEIAILNKANEELGAD